MLRADAHERIVYARSAGCKFLAQDQALRVSAVPSEAIYC